MRLPTFFTLASISFAGICGSYFANAHQAPIAAPNEKGWEYDADCCHDKDCRQLKPDEIQTDSDGYLITPHDTLRRFFVSYQDKDKIRESKDEFYHVCINIKFVRCLYVPSNGV